MGYDFILFDTVDSVATITMNRPERLNALNTSIGIEIMDALGQCEHDDEVRVVVLTGAGRAFCAGDDIKRVPEEETKTPPRFPDPVKHYVYGPGRWVTIVRTMMRMPKPVVGIINGHAHGAGFNLALGCDFRIMSETATLCTPFVKRGMATGTNRLQQFVGIGKALEWTMLGKTLSAQESERWGLTTMVVPPDRLQEAAAEFIEVLKAAPTAIIGITKNAVVHGWERDPDTAYEYQGAAINMSRLTDDSGEGRRAFVEKRSPRYNGRWSKEGAGDE